MIKHLILFLFTIFAACLFLSCGMSRQTAMPDQQMSLSKEEYQSYNKDDYPVAQKKSAGYSNREIQQQQRYKKSKQVQDVAQQENKESKLVYTGEISLEIRNLKETQDKIIQVMEEVKGFIVSQSQYKMVIRVPSEKFQDTVKSIAMLGAVLDKKIFTYDVTDQYFDIQRRLELSEKAKARLLDMLSKVKDVKEKVKIIEEIQRISKEIEYYKQVMASLDSFIQYSIIEILLTLPQGSRDINQQASPFYWINQLNPDQISLESVSSKSVSLDLPGGYLIFNKESTFTARNPEGSFIRAGKTVNDPLGDSVFWKKALDNGMIYKNFEKIKEGKDGRFLFSIFEYKTIKPFYYLVALSVVEKEIYVIEVFFPSQESLKKHADSLVQKLDKLQIKE